MRYIKLLKMVLFYRPFSYRQFRYWCLHIEGMSFKEWFDLDRFIKNEPVLSNFFKLNKTK